MGVDLRVDLIMSCTCSLVGGDLHCTAPRAQYHNHMLVECHSIVLHEFFQL